MLNCIRKTRILLLVMACLLILVGCSDKDTDNEDNKTAESKSQVEQVQETEKVADAPLEEKSSAVANSSSVKKESSATEKSTKAKTSKPASSSKKWVPAVYKTVEHPATTRQRKYIDYYTCQCGQQFSSEEAWQAHRPKPCNGLHTFAEPHIAYETITEPAWSEQVLVSEGHYE